MGISQPVLAVFDRSYPSIEFIEFLETEGIHYLIRLSSNDYKAERKQMQSEDDNVILKHSSAHLQKIRKKHPELFFNNMVQKVLLKSCHLISGSPLSSNSFL
jgi:hypothetical protein